MENYEKVIKFESMLAIMKQDLELGLDFLRMSYNKYRMDI